jgi:hypothetical protein
MDIDFAYDLGRNKEQLTLAYTMKRPNSESTLPTTEDPSSRTNDSWRSFDGRRRRYSTSACSRRRTKARGRVQLGLDKRVEDGRKRRSRVLREVVQRADSADTKKIETMVTTTISTTTLVITRCCHERRRGRSRRKRRGRLG